MRPQRRLRLWYRQPAGTWLEALPLGNGALGAMVFGGAPEERLALNEESFWSGGPHDGTRAEARSYLPEVRRLIFAGEYAEAQELAEKHLMGDPIRLQAFQPVGDLLLRFDHGEEVAAYERELDLEVAVARVTYNVGGVRLRRELFVSAVDQVLAVRIVAEGGLIPPLRVRLRGPFFARTEAEGCGLRAVGRWRELEEERGSSSRRVRGKSVAEGLRVATYVGVESDGQVRAQADEVAVIEAQTVVVYAAVATDYRGGDPEEITCTRVQRAQARGYALVREVHVQDHRRLFGRVGLTVDGDLAEDSPTDERIRAVKSGKDDPDLPILFFHYGRYLLIASSRPGTLPATLQGIWNEDLEPPWGSKWTLNINAEMNYWPAEVCNLPECHEPLFALLDELVTSGQRTASVHYGCRGAVAHHNTDLWQATVPCDGARWGLWPMGMAWLATHVGERFAFHPDVEFLARCYPTLREIVLFYVDFLVEDPHTGYLVTCPSLSPENAFRTPSGEVASVCAGPAMDTELLRDVFGLFAEASRRLGRDAELRAQVEKLSARLAPLQVGPDGRLQEWSRPFEEDEPGHRHLSHLYALYPSAQIRLQTTPELAQAARRALERRIACGSGSTGWSRAWIVNLFARLGEGDRAYAHLMELLRRFVAPNLFDLHPPGVFQIDGNFGACAGVAEMLLQSYRDREGVEILILPALPGAWRTGEFRGLRARGGLLVDARWEGGILQALHLRAERDGVFTVQVPRGTGLLCLADVLVPHEVVAPAVEECATLPARAGHAYVARFQEGRCRTRSVRSSE